MKNYERNIFSLVVAFFFGSVVVHSCYLTYMYCFISRLENSEVSAVVTVLVQTGENTFTCLQQSLQYQ